MCLTPSTHMCDTNFFSIIIQSNYQLTQEVWSSRQKAAAAKRKAFEVKIPSVSRYQSKSFIVIYLRMLFSYK